MTRLPSGFSACLLAVFAIACSKGHPDGGSPGSAAPVVAMPAQVNYEEERVMTALHRLHEKIYANQASHGMFLEGSVGLTPKVTCCSTGDGQCGQSDADWTDPVWIALDFKEIAAATHFRYSYEGDRLHFTANATADIDCDGRLTTWQIKGAYGTDGVAVITEPALVTAP